MQTRYAYLGKPHSSLIESCDKIMGMKSRLKFTIAILFFSLLSGLPLLSHAQIPSSIDGIQIGTNPDLPAPGQTITVNVESFSTDLNSASIVWLVDGKNLTQGTGKKSVGLTAPEIGKSITVTAVIKTVEGREVRKIITIKSGGVDLIWESAGFVPPLFRGKSTFVYQNPVKIIAMPHLAGANGVEIDPKTLVYKWKNNDKVLQDQSGYGKQVITIQDDLPRSLQIEVEISNRDGTSKAAGSMSLEPGDPSLSFYQEDPIYGVLYNLSLINKVRLTNQELSLRAVPYSFNISSASPLTYIWSVNDLERTDLSTNESITLRTKGDSEGSSNIALTVKSAGNILQGARNGVSVLFTKKLTSTNTAF